MPLTTADTALLGSLEDAILNEHVIEEAMVAALEAAENTRGGSTSGRSARRAT